LRERYRRENDRAEKLKTLDAALAKGLADAEAGKVMPLKTAFKRLRKELALPARKAAN
jgi:antitoxin ParD1/3/4